MDKLRRAWHWWTCGRRHHWRGDDTGWWVCEGWGRPMRPIRVGDIIQYTRRADG